MTNVSKVAYWTSTILLSFGMLSGGFAQLARVKQTADGIVHLGYPPYFMSILGTWKIIGVIVLLIPKLPLLKEWAYAGFFFAMTGATMSHIASGDNFAEFIAPLIFALLTAVSWHFRPVDRKIIANAII